MIIALTELEENEIHKRCVMCGEQDEEHLVHYTGIPDWCEDCDDRYGVVLPHIRSINSYYPIPYLDIGFNDEDDEEY